MDHAPLFRIFSLGDSALVIDFGNRISESLNRKVISLFHLLQQHPLPGMVEAVPAYSSLAIFYDLISLQRIVPGDITVFEWMKKELDIFLSQDHAELNEDERLVEIPVCYHPDFGTDLLHQSDKIKIPVEEIIQLHESVRYRVYMLGFLPGFAYMGEVNEKIFLPRKTDPVPVAAGSVGIAGKQTGIYPLDSPGGWQVIGKTPLKLFEPGKKEPALLRTGDQVKFFSITKNDFYEIQNTNQ